MNIGLITHSISNRSGSRAPLRLAESLKQKNHQVTIYAYNYGLDTQVLESLNKNGIKTVLYGGSTHSFVPFPLRGWSTIFKVIRDLRSGDHDIISFHSTLPFLLASKFSRSPILTTYYGTELSYSRIRREAGLPLSQSWGSKLKDYATDFVLLQIQKLMFKLSPQVTAISFYLKNEAKKLFGVDCSVIYLGSETELFLKSQKVEEKNYILSVSRIVPYKGFDFLINSFEAIRKDFPETELIIVGSSPNRKYLEKLKKLASPKVKILSNMSDKQLRELYSNCSVYAVCDLWVPWSLTPLEASYFGKPLLGLDNGAMKEIIKNNENGILAENIEEFSNSLGTLLAEPAKRKKFGSTAQEMVDRFTWAKTANQYEIQFEKIRNENPKY